MGKQSSRYTIIAIDIATMIKNGELSVDDRISGRSTLAGKYNVSPETIRRAVTLLKDFGVVDSTPKNGIKILSSRKASEFLAQHQNKNSFMGLKDDIATIINEKNNLEKTLVNKVNQMMDQLTISRDVGSLQPLEVDIPMGSHLIGKTIAESEFWDNTKATIVCIKRADQTTLSPGPHWRFEENDIIVFIGKRNSYPLVVKYVKK